MRRWVSWYIVKNFRCFNASKYFKWKRSHEKSKGVMRARRGFCNKDYLDKDF